MFNTIYDINLMDGNQFIKNYSWYVIPNVGDKLSIDEKTIFIVNQRLLPTTFESSRVVLFGTIV